MGPLQLRQFAKEAIVDRVRDFGFALDVIEIVVAPDLIPQGNESSLDFCRRHAIEKFGGNVPKGTSQNQLLSQRILHGQTGDPAPISLTFAPLAIILSNPINRFAGTRHAMVAHRRRQPHAMRRRT
jgi:hypothetical protein